jgi:hypothetical protein
LGTGSKGHLAADNAGRTDLGSAGADHVIEATTLEIVRRDCADAIAKLRISIDV